MAQNKEFINKAIQNLTHHIKTNHSNLTNVKIYENIGDHPYVIKFTPFTDYDINLTLQITSDFNLSNSVIILNKVKHKKGNDQKILNSLEEILNEKIKGMINEKILIKFFEKALEFIEKNFEKYQNNDEQKTKKKDVKISKNKSDEEDEKNTKKVSMKTASDVVHRIQWDEEIKQEFITVGYIDRFLGLKECLFTTFDWGDIVLADYGALAIPEHRITYFKYKNEIIWDKKNRLDNIFGSTGSGITIRDVITRLENLEFNLPINDEEPRNKIGKNEVKDEHPTHFISIPINKLKSNFDKLNSDLLEFNQEVESFLVPDASMHLTLLTLRVEASEEIEIVKKIMNEIVTSEEFKKIGPINLKFKGIGEFYQKVLYSKCESDCIDKLKVIKNLIFDKLSMSNVNTAGNYYDFVPHLTVFKIKNNMNNSNMCVNDFVGEFLWDKYVNFDFGNENINEIQLCKMTNLFVSKAYPIEHSVHFVDHHT